MSAKVTVTFIASAVFTIVVIVVALALGDREEQPSGVEARSITDENPQPYAIRLTAYSALMTPEQLVYRSDTGAIGEVVAVSEARWSTQSGKTPHGWKPGDRLPQPEVIYRSVTLRVESALFGPAGSEISVAVIGGSADGVEMTFDDALSPQLNVGDRAAVFVVKPPDGWRLGSQNDGLIQGYKVTGGQALSSDGSSLSIEDLTRRTHAEFERRQAGALEPAK